MKPRREERFSNYILAVFDACQKHPEWRIGQAYFSVLNYQDSKLADYIVKYVKEIDPFYNDNNIPAFLARVYQAWS